MTLYGISNCDTVRKARNWLAAHDISFEFYDYRSEGISDERIKGWLTQIPLEKLLNKASTTFRELPDREKESVTKKPAAIRIMIKNPTIIKRPVLEDDQDRILAVGFKEETYRELFER